VLLKCRADRMSCFDREMDAFGFRVSNQYFAIPINLTYMRLFLLICPLLLIFSQLKAQEEFGNLLYVTKPIDASYISTGDFDGNGLNDIIYLTSGLTILYNQGNYNFDSLFLQQKGGTTSIGDLNKDNKSDIVSLSQPTKGEKTLFIFIAKENRTFENTEISLPSDFSLAGMFLTDLDNDSNTDIILSNSSTSFLFKGDGTGKFIQSTLTFATPSNRFVAADINGDGLKDLVFLNGSGKLVTEINSLNSAFQEISQDIPEGGFTWDLADFSGDTYPDLILNSYSNSGGYLYYLKNDGSGKMINPIVISTTSTLPTTIVNHYDYNNDGSLDIITAGVSGTGTLALKNLGNNSFEEIQLHQEANGSSRGLVITNLNNDGPLEFIELSNERCINVFGQNADHNYQLKKHIILGLFGVLGEVADINADKTPDIIVASANGALMIFKGKGEFQFESPEVFQTAGGGVTGVSIADFNEDSYPDIVYSSGIYQDNSNETDILLSNSNGQLGQPIKIGDSNSSLTKGTDFNGDGHLDFGSGFDLYFGDGTGKFTLENVGIGIPGIAAISFDAGQFNDDNLADLVTRDYNYALYFSSNKGSGKFDPFTKLSFTHTFEKINLANLDSDKYTDIISIDTIGGHSISILKGAADGNFNEIKIQLSNKIYLEGNADMADFNNDGRMDIVTGVSYNDGTDDWLLGTLVILQNQDQSFTPTDFNSAENGNGWGPPDFIIARDINNDKKQDILTFNYNSDPIIIYPNAWIAEPSKVTGTITVNNITNELATLKANKGTGNGRLFVIRQSDSPIEFPADGIFYSQSPTFASGDDLGDHNYVIYGGSDSVVTVSSLKSKTEYTVSSFEYNVNEKKTIINYLTINAPSVTFKTAVVAGLESLQTSIIAYPNPVKENLSIKVPENLTVKKINLIGQYGEIIQTQISYDSNKISISMDSLQPGIYFIKVHTNKETSVIKLLKL
jgi:hypothetical protein